MKRCWCTCWLCPGCHGGGTGGAGGEAAFKGRGKHTPAICFLWQRHGHENLWCLASHTNVRGREKILGKDHCALASAFHKMALGLLNTATVVQRGTQNGTTEQLSIQVECTNIKYRSSGCYCTMTQVVG